MTDQDPERRLHDQLFGIRRSVRYHMRRQAFFDRVNDRAALVTAIAGSATVATLLAKDLGPAWSNTAAVLTAVLSACSLVFSPGRMARKHNDLARAFIALEQEAIRPDAPERLVEIQNKRLSIEADEPPIYRVLDTICRNDLMRALGYPDEQLIRVPALVYMLANLTDFGFRWLKRSA